MPVSLEVKGMEGVFALLKAIEKIGKVSVRGAQLLGTKRKDGSGKTNTEVADELIEREFDFFSAGGIEDDMAAEFARIADVEMQQAADKIAVATRQAAKDPRLAASSAERIASRVANQISSAGFRAAAEVWRKEIVDRIESGKDANGMQLQVSEEYAKWRQREYGVPQDAVGTATGDLLANMADSKAIKLTSG